MSKSRKLFVNLAVKDLQKSMQFFSKLGFEFNPQFTDQNAACMVINGDAFVMLLANTYFKTFTKRPIADTTKQTEGLFCLSADSKAAVDMMVKTAITNGGSHAMPVRDLGFMYGWSFYDLDGHHWEVAWMDEAALAKGEHK